MIFRSTYRMKKEPTMEWSGRSMVPWGGKILCLEEPGRVARNEIREISRGWRCWEFYSHCHGSHWRVHNKRVSWCGVSLEGHTGCPLGYSQCFTHSSNTTPCPYLYVPRRGIAESYIMDMLNFTHYVKLCSKVLGHLCYYQQWLPCLNTIVPLFNFSTLKGVKWHLDVVLMCISLTNRGGASFQCVYCSFSFPPL